MDPSLIVLDTLNRNFGGGQENSDQDMTQFVGGCDDLRRRFPGSSVLVVHHSGKVLSRGDRGSTVMRGAVDTRMQLKRTEMREGLKTSALLLTVEAQRNAAEIDPLKLKLEKYVDACIIEVADELTAKLLEMWPPKKAENDADDETKALTTLPEGGIRFNEWHRASRWSPRAGLKRPRSG